jgi:hypothetical protein
MFVLMLASGAIDPGTCEEEGVFRWTTRTSIPPVTLITSLVWIKQPYKNVL